MKKIVILKHGGGELANQLWNYVSVYAAGLELGAEVRNPSFFEYHSSFNLVQNESGLTRAYSQLFRTPRRRSHLRNRTGRWIYLVIARIRLALNSKCVLSSQNSENREVYLPPTESLSETVGTCETTYTIGWLFRNPVGLKKYREELIRTFSPTDHVQKKVGEVMQPLREKYASIIGVHIRQGDYATFQGGKYLVSTDQVRNAVHTYIDQQALNTDNTLFFITSDGPVNPDILPGLHTFISHENAVTDLFALAQTDAIIGSRSTFNGFAAWYGGIERTFFDELQ